MRIFLVLAFFTILSLPAAAQEDKNGAVKTEINTLYSKMTEMMNRAEPDVEAFVAYTKSHYTDDLRAVSFITDRATGQTTPVENTKQELLDMIPNSYGRAFNTHTTIDMKEVRLSGDGREVEAVYTLVYSTDLRPQDQNGVTYERKMAMDSECNDLLRQTGAGGFQIYKSTCQATMDYGTPKIYAGPGQDSGAE